MALAQYLADAPADEFFWWTAVPLVLACAALAGCFVFLHRKRLMEDMPTSVLRSAAQGYIEVEGIARLMEGAPIICPLTSTRCVWWRYQIEEKQGDGKGRKSWVTIARAVSDDSFLLDDGSGVCVVDPTGAKVIPAVRHVWYGHHSRPDRGPGQGGGFWRALVCDYRFTEELVPPASPLYALGAYRTQAALAHAADEQLDLKELLTKWKHDPKMMAMFDVDKDGAVSMKEWEAARRMALKKVREEHIEHAVNTPDLHLLARSRDGRPYILSAIPQAELVRRYTFQAAGCLGAFALAIGFFLWGLGARGIL